MEKYLDGVVQQKMLGVRVAKIYFGGRHGGRMSNDAHDAR